MDGDYLRAVQRLRGAWEKGGCTAHRSDLLQHRLQVRFNLIIPHPQHLVSISRQLCRSFGILFHLPAMHSPIHLDLQQVLRAVEIDNQASDRMLSPEFKAIKPSVAQPDP
jgi:hypothetical protein